MPEKLKPNVRIFPARIWLTSPEDDDLIALFENAPKRGRSNLIKAAMRNGIHHVMKLDLSTLNDSIDDLDTLTE
jgi:hypothetical protein